MLMDKSAEEKDQFIDTVLRNMQNHEHADVVKEHKDNNKKETVKETEEENKTEGQVAKRVRWQELDANRDSNQDPNRRVFIPDAERPLSSLSHHSAGGDEKDSDDDFKDPHGYKKKTTEKTTKEKDKPSKEKKKSKPAIERWAPKGIDWQGYGTRLRIQPDEWKDDQPRASFWKLASETDLNNINFLKDMPPDLKNPKNCKIINPQDCDAVVIEGVTKKDVNYVLVRDGKYWKQRHDQTKNFDDGTIKFTYRGGGGQWVNAFQNKVKKHIYFNEKNQTMVVVYDGDMSYSHLTEASERIFAEDEKPTGIKKYPEPSIVCGDNRFRYAEWYKEDYLKRATAERSRSKEKTPPGSPRPPRSPGPSKSPTTTGREEGATDVESSEKEKDSDAESDTEELRQKATPRLENYTHEGWSHKHIKKMYEDAVAEDVWQHVDKFGITEPKAGEVYFLDYKDYEHNIFKHVRADGYNWNNKTVRPIKNEYLARCGKYVASNGVTGKFRRHQYFIWNQQKLIVHYCGDHSVVSHRRHGNASKDTNVFVTQSVEVLDDIRGLVGKARPAKIYSKLTSKSEKGLLGLATHPRNLEQVRNQQKLEKAKLEAEVGYQVSLVNYSLGQKFVEREKYGEDNNQAFFMIDNKVREEVKNIIAKNKATDKPLIFFYDTSFNAGGPHSGFVVSHLCLAHPYVNAKGQTGEFDHSAVIIVSSMLHHRKFKDIHQAHMTFAANELFLHQIKSGSVFISDNEFVKLQLWPNASHALCWNHIQSDVWYKAKETFKLRSIHNLFDNFYNIYKQKWGSVQQQHKILDIFMIHLLCCEVETVKFN